MIDSPSIWNYRVTMTYLRICLTCQSHSQADFIIVLTRAIAPPLSRPLHALVTI